MCTRLGDDQERSMRVRPWLVASEDVISYRIRSLYVDKTTDTSYQDEERETSTASLTEETGGG